VRERGGVLSLTGNGSGAQTVAELYSAARGSVFRYLVCLGLDAARAQDVTQEAFLRLLATVRDGKTVESPRSWVYRVAHNLAMDALEAEARVSAYSEAVAETLCSLDKNAEQEMIEREWMEGFEKAVERLSRQQRQVLELRAEGLRYREIAEVLEVRISTVGEFLRRAIHGLRKSGTWRH
jgi:RNA polymerase sigma-70 factor (ECF subfamily)